MLKKEIIVAMVIAFSGMALAAPYESDNTKVNVRDTTGATVTPQDQSKGSPKDIELTRMIRQEIVSDKSLSTNGHNIKIVTLGGIVTLRGPVNSQQEKERIDSMVQKTVKKTGDVIKVDNQLEIKTK